MSGEQDRKLSRKYARQFRDRYDRQVRQAICSAKWTAQWSAYAASLAPTARRGEIATAWIQLRNPEPLLLASLARLGYLFGSGDAWYLTTGWSNVDCPLVLERSSKTTVRVLSKVLGNEADFEVIVIPSSD